MRILIYNWRDLAHPNAGGAEVYTHNVAKQWVAWGHQVTWFTSTVHGRPPVEEVDGIRIIRRAGRFGVYRQARRFYEQEGKGQFDVVVDEINTRPFSCPEFVHDTPVVALIHQVCREIWFYETPLPVALLGRYWLETRWLRKYRDVAVLTVSESSRESLISYGLSNVVVLPEGGTPRTCPLPRKENRPTVIFVGRLTPNKRPEHAVAAFERARKVIPALQMWVVGSGSLETKLRKKVDGDVHFFGRVPEDQKYDLLAKAHVLIVTSVREGWGLVVSEAAAVGTSVIAYDVPGLRDAAEASAGCIVRPDPDEMARQIIRHFSGESNPIVPVQTSGGTVPWADVAGDMLREVESVVQGARSGR